MRRPERRICHARYNRGRQPVRTVHWLFVVSVALFLSGLAFVIAGARLARAAPNAAPAPASDAVTPVASVKQIMKGIVGPAAQRVFDSVGTTVTRNGTEEKAPRTDEEWEAVGNDAAALIESGNLILMKGRAIDNDEWFKMSQAMVEAGKAVLRATEARSPDKVMETGGDLYETCDSCHKKYRRTT
jgi:hypothetical protein